MFSAKILVVEDFEQFRRFIVSTLRETGKFQVMEASDGLAALQKAEEHSPDLVLLDIGLPSLNGIEVARRLGRLPVASKIVFVSQESSPEVVGEASYLGALGYVHKMRARTDLLPAVEAALEGRRFVSSGLQIGRASDAQAQPRHEILFCSDPAALIDAIADFIAQAFKSGNPALVRAAKSRQDNLHAELRARGVDVDSAIEQGTYMFIDVDEPSDQARIAVKRVSEAASKAGKKQPRVAVCSERAGLTWAEGKTDEAIRLEQRANEFATQENVDILCPYPSMQGDGDSAFKSVCAEHSAVSFR